MIINDKNAGTKIPFEVDADKIVFNEELEVNLADEQKDEPVHINICFDKSRQLMVGTKDAWAYVAEIDIPARAYSVPESEEESPVPVPLDMDNVKLTLWAVGR